MFHGSIPAPLRSIIYEHAGTWPGDDIWIGCSGNYTIERVLHSRFGDARRVHGNDIQAYSCALGWWLAGDPLTYTLREEYQDVLGWLSPYLDDPTDLLATLMLGTRFLQWVGRDGAYYRRMMAATQAQWPRMHDKTATKLRNLTVRLGSFYAGDVRDYLTDAVPADAPVVMFPPFYCLAPEHRLLTADLRWVPCGELRAGDRLLAFDEETPGGFTHRRLRWSEIVRSEPAMKECVRVILEDGTGIVCTEDHPWLADRYDRPSRVPRKWVRADRLLEEAPYVIRLTDTWEPARTYEAGWLAGVLDGEGSVYLGKSASKAGISQRPGIVADQYTAWMKELGFDTTVCPRPSGVCSYDMTGGWPEMLRALGTLRPERLVARVQQLEIERLSIRSRGNPRVKVVAVERVGVRPIQSITTTTGTYIGEGFAMHNSGDYQAQFASIDTVFDWPTPSFRDLDEDGKEEIIAQVRDRPNWVLGLHIERPELRRHLAGVVQTANRGLPIYVYAASGPRRIVRPHQPTAPIPMPKIGPDDELGERMTLHVLTGGQFAAIRSQFMSKSIKPGTPLIACGVAVDGLLIGAFAYLPPKYEPSCAYLMSDFPVSWTKYRRLAKLIVMAASTKEAQLLVQRSLSRRITAWSTTAFTDRPNSAKYGRGIPGVKLQKRTEPGGDGIHAYQLQYGGPLGAYTLDEALQLWKRKHGTDMKKDDAR
ncbi:Hint domain-containing protein [Planomonospora corallina]|uniref:Hint domain-containing protein n=1 Tax=Planomonospora corallina TaxID=1806052 RepID=A0ABV8I7U0_9ACTN